MNTSSAFPLFDDAPYHNSPHRTSINSTLWFDDRDGYRVLFCRHEVLYRISLTDSFHLALVAVTLRQSQLATQLEIATAFGHSVATQRRWESHYQQYGSAGLQPDSPPGRPTKLDAGQSAFIARWFQQGASNHEMAKRLSVSEATIRRALQKAGLQRQATPIAELPLDAGDPILVETTTPPLTDSVVTPAELPLDAAPIPAEPSNTPLSVDSAVAPTERLGHTDERAPVEPTAPQTDSAVAPAALPLDAAPLPANPTIAPAPAAPAPAAPAMATPESAPVVPAQEIPPFVPTANPGVAAPMPSAEGASPPKTPFAVGTPQANAYTADRDPADRSGDRALARMGVLHDAVPLFGDHLELPRAGVLLAIPILQRHGGLEVFLRLYDTLGPGFYGLRTTVTSLFLLALLRIKHPENLKEYSPEQLGRVVGLDRMAEVKTLRRKLTILAQRKQGHELMNELARLRLDQDEDRLAFLYLDGHIREYSGNAELAKAKKAQRSVATRAATDTWLHDSDGAPLLVVTSEMNEGLTLMLEAIVLDAKKLVAEGQRLTVLFDRGGWSPKLFAHLIALGVDIITYYKGKRKLKPHSHFDEYQVQEDGQEKTYWLCDQLRARVGRLRAKQKKRRVAGKPGFLWLRLITVLREDGRQTTIVTNRTDLSTLEVVLRLFRRWRQENYFKYMDAEFALDALAEYGVEDVSEEATRLNPERKRVSKERKQVKGEVLRLQADLGAKVEPSQGKGPSNMRAFKIAEVKVRQELEQAQLRERELAEELRQLPKRVSAKGMKTLKKEKKLIVDAIKIMAYQCETELLDRLRPHYARTEEEGRTLLTSAFQSSASMKVTDTELQITIDAQSSPHRSEALAKVCHELDAEKVCYPGTSLQIRLAVKGQEPLTE